MVSMRFPWKRCGWYLAFVGSASPTLPQSVESCRRNQPTIFQVWGRHSWRESANEGPFHAATSSKLEPCCLMGALWIRCAERYATEGGRVGGISTPATGVALQDRVRKSNKQSILDTAWLATYSSLRRKKSTRQAGEMRHNPRRFSALLVRAELFLIHYWGQGTYGSLASLPQTEERA